MRISAAFRGLVMGALGALSLSVTTPRPVRADVTDLFGLLRPAVPQAPRTVSESRPRPLLLNGFPLRLLSGRTPETPQQVLDYYEQHVRRTSKGPVPPPVFRRDGEDFGLLVATEGDGEELLRQMAARKLHYVHLGPLCMVFAQQTGELTTYLAITSGTPLPAEVLMPRSGHDAPGADLPGVPRPPGSLRSFSLSEPAAGYTAVSYVADQPAESAFTDTLSTLRDAGFALDRDFGSAAYRAGSLLMRVQRGRQDLLVSAQPHHGTAQRSLILYVVRSL